MGIPLIEGRTFNAGDRRRAARRDHRRAHRQAVAGQSPIGKRLASRRAAGRPHPGWRSSASSATSNTRGSTRIRADRSTGTTGSPRRIARSSSQVPRRCGRDGRRDHRAHPRARSGTAVYDVRTMDEVLARSSATLADDGAAGRSPRWRSSSAASASTADRVRRGRQRREFGIRLALGASLRAALPHRSWHGA